VIALSWFLPSVVQNFASAVHGPISHLPLLSVVFLNMGIIIYNVIQIALGSIPGRTAAKIQCKMNLII
jgi:hypothetical protein